MKNLLRAARMATLLAGSLAFLAGCGGEDAATVESGPAKRAGTGTLTLALTDNPACGYDNVFVTIERIRVHQSASAADNAVGWYDIVPPLVKRVDLLDLTNGVLEELGQTPLPAGSYTQMRLVLAANGGAPLANAVKPTGGSETALKTPSGQQSGLKANVNITVEANKTADFVIDIDACKSVAVVKAGNSGQYLLKPVITVIPVLSDAGQRIVGYLDPATLGASTTVSAQEATGADAGKVVKATPPDANGKFVLYPVPPGTYSLVVASTGRATAVMTGVPVSTTAHTNIGAETGPRIALVASATKNATGVVTLNTSAADTGASVRALQTPFNGPKVEVAAMPVDAVSGAYSMALPVEPPRLASHAAYIANATAILFTADSANVGETAAGKYTIEAAIDGLATQTSPQINVGSGNVATNFTFTDP